MTARVKKLGKNRPAPLRRGVVQETSAWKNAVERIDKGEEVGITLPDDFLRDKGLNNLQGNIISFAQSLRRYVERKKLKYHVYVAGNTVYASRTN